LTERWRIIDPVTQHRDDFALSAQRSNNRQFVFRTDSTERADTAQPLLQGVRTQLPELAAVQRFSAG
jgi:hypothetical protein